MHWSRIKSILIAVFIIVDAYLLIQYFKINENTDMLSSTTLENTITLLEKNNITVPDEAIPRIIERSSKTGKAYKTAADALVSFSAMAQKKNITPCEVTELVLDEGKWIITTNKGQYIFDAETLSILSEN